MRGRRLPSVRATCPPSLGLPPSDCAVGSVTIAGHADRSGPAAYNVRLSARRAQTVRDALVARGISADMISTEAFGETAPAKPTADGVREPLNRRSEVVIRVR